MEEKKSKASQHGYEVVDVEKYIKSSYKVGGVENLYKNLNDAKQKAMQETAKKEISPEDFQSFSANVNTYLDVFEKAFLNNEKAINQNSSTKIGEIEDAIKGIRDLFSKIEKCRIAEKDLSKKKDEHDLLYKQIVEFETNPVYEKNIDSRNYDIELLAEKYGPALDAYKEAKKDYIAKKEQMDEFINNINVQDFKNDIFRQLAIIDVCFKKSDLYQINGIAEALQTLRGSIEMEIGMFGVTLSDDKYSRDYEELCKQYGVVDSSNRNQEINNEQVDIKQEAKTPEPIRETVSKDLDEEQIKKEIMSMAGLTYSPKEVVEEKPIEDATFVPVSDVGVSEPEEVVETPVAEEEVVQSNEEVPNVPFEMPFVDSIASQLEDNQIEQKKDDVPQIATDPFFNQGVFEIPSIEEEKLDNPLDYIDQEFVENNDNVVDSTPEEPTPAVQEPVVEQPVGEPPIENIEDAEALLDEYEVPEVETAAYLQDPVQRDANSINASEVVEESLGTVDATEKKSLRKKIKEIRKSVSNKYLKAIMTAGAISGFTEKINSDKVAEAVINADFASGVEKLGNKMKTYGSLESEVYVKDSAKSAKEQIGEIASVVKGKFLSVYTGIKTKMKNLAASPAPDNSNVEEQLTNTEGAVR